MVRRPRPKCNADRASSSVVRSGSVDPPILRADDAALQFAKLIVCSRMWKNINLERCLSHIRRLPDIGRSGPPGGKPAITLSRMCGSGGRTVASLLVEHLQPLAPYGGHWTVFDHDLIKKVLEDHSLSARLAEFLPESNKFLLAEMREKLHGTMPLRASTIVEQSVETIWQLAAGGHVILVGRGANVIKSKNKNVFHVRLVGSLEKRIERVEELYDFDRRAAVDFIKAQDAARKLYLKEYFGQDIDNPELYHVVFNTDRISYQDAARLIADAVINRSKQISSAP